MRTSLTSEQKQAVMIAWGFDKQIAEQYKLRFLRWAKNLLCGEIHVVKKNGKVIGCFATNREWIHAYVPEAVYVKSFFSLVEKQLKEYGESKTCQRADNEISIRFVERFGYKIYDISGPFMFWRLKESPFLKR